MTLTVIFACIGASLLLLRQERLRLAHEVMDEYRECQIIKTELWCVETKVSAVTTPGELSQRISASRLAFEPNVPKSSVVELAQGY